MQKQLPVTLAAAGLPQIPAACRRGALLRRAAVPVSRTSGRCADRRPCCAGRARRARRRELRRGRNRRTLELTQGYPFYIQEYGKHIWNLARSLPYTRDDVETARPRAEEALDRGIYEVRIQRATHEGATLPTRDGRARRGPYKVGAVAKAMGSTTTALSTVRQKLLDRGLIYATEDYGHVDFTVPRFDEFMRRHMTYRRPAARASRAAPQTRS